jgi:hypothetical protein
MFMREGSRKRRLAILFVFVFPLFLVFIALMVWAVQALWNGLMPDIFKLGTVTYWQALGLMVLSWILFRGFRGPSGSRGFWDSGMRRRWQRMTAVERDEFIEALRRRWGGAGGTDPSGAPPNL